VHFIRQNNQIEVILDLSPFSNIYKVLPLKVFTKIT